MGRRVVRYRILASAGFAAGVVVAVVWIVAGGSPVLAVLAGAALAVGCAIPLVAFSASPGAALRDDPELESMFDTARVDASRR